MTQRRLGKSRRSYLRLQNLRQIFFNAVVKFLIDFRSVAEIDDIGQITIVATLFQFFQNIIRHNAFSRYQDIQTRRFFQIRL